jgi:hypothetical protein
LRADRREPQRRRGAPASRDAAASTAVLARMRRPLDGGEARGLEAFEELDELLSVVARMCAPAICGGTSTGRGSVRIRELLS